MFKQNAIADVDSMLQEMDEVLCIFLLCGTIQSILIDIT